MKLNSYKKNYLKAPPSKALAAVAFQDHLLRDLSIDDLSTVPQRKKMTVNDSLRLQEKRRKLALRNAKSTIDTGLKKSSTSNLKIQPKEEAEYVLDIQPEPLSLAQKLGLIPPGKDQKKLLSENEWKSLKEAANKREDFKNPCPICKDDFRTEDQVLLSCSHCFHKACLQAFERFTGKKSCPMCRRESYQTRVVHEGAKFYKQKSATRIQAYWRGYVVRKWYKKLRKTVVPKDPGLRKKFYEDKLSEITDRMVAMTSGDTVDRFLSDMDQSLAHSRNVFRFFEKSVLSHLTVEEWLDIEERAVERGATECSICLRALAFTEPDRKNIESHRGTETAEDANDAIALLSCSHVFHMTCLNALEQFSLEGLDMTYVSSDPFMNGSPSFKCPVCRAIYLKRIVSS